MARKKMVELSLRFLSMDIAKHLLAGCLPMPCIICRSTMATLPGSIPATATMQPAGMLRGGRVRHHAPGAGCRRGRGCAVRAAI